MPSARRGAWSASPLPCSPSLLTKVRIASAVPCTAERPTPVTSPTASMRSNMPRAWWCSYVKLPTGSHKSSSEIMVLPCLIRPFPPASFIAANVVPKDCVFHFDMRTLPQASPDALYQEIRTYAQALAAEMRLIDANAGIDLQWMSQTVGLAAAETDAIVQWAMQLSRNPTVGKVSYGTEAGLFQKMGVPTVICGPGDIAEAHRPNEFVALDQLAQCESFMDRILETGYAKAAQTLEAAT